MASDLCALLRNPIGRPRPAAPGISVRPRTLGRSGGGGGIPLMGTFKRSYPQAENILSGAEDVRANAYRANESVGPPITEAETKPGPPTN